MTVSDALKFLDIKFGTPSASDIKKAYRRQQMKWHPDRHIGTSFESHAVELSKKINLAYEVLSELVEIDSSVYSNASSSYSPEHRYEDSYFTPGFPDSTVFEVFVKSSHIVSSGFRERDNTLFMKFKGDRVYIYKDVPKSIFEQFLGAPSHGKFAHKYIYNKYRYEKLNEPNVPYSGPALN